MRPSEDPAHITDIERVGTIDQEHLQKLVEDFSLGEVQSAEETHEGVLNRNFIVRTDRGVYFVKSIRDKRKEDIPHIAGVELLMHERGIPAVCMLQNKAGQSFSMYGTDIYTVYPFIESDRSHTYTPEDYVNIGAMLGKIHRAGSHDVPKELQTRVRKVKDESVAQESIQMLKDFHTEISAKEHDEIDNIFLPYIERKLRLTEQLRPVENLPNDTLVHGDYHAGNLLIDTLSRAIIGICDWEKAEMSPRSYELARSILYVSFHVGYKVESAIQTAKQFLAGYQKEYPIDRKEIEQGFAARLHNVILSTWLEIHHYRKGDKRANQFIENEHRHLQDFVEADMLQRIFE